MSGNGSARHRNPSILSSWALRQLTWLLYSCPQVTCLYTAINRKSAPQSLFLCMKEVSFYRIVPLDHTDYVFSCKKGFVLYINAMFVFLQEYRIWSFAQGQDVLLCRNTRPAPPFVNEGLLYLFGLLILIVCLCNPFSSVEILHFRYSLRGSRSQTCSVLEYCRCNHFTMEKIYGNSCALQSALWGMWAGSSVLSKFLCV